MDGFGREQETAYWRKIHLKTAAKPSNEHVVSMLPVILLPVIRTQYLKSYLTFWSATFVFCWLAQ